jgi:hypothetical protein
MFLYQQDNSNIKCENGFNYLSCYSPTGPEPATGVGEDETMFIRP